MSHTPKLMLTIVACGVLLGAGLGHLASPTMKFAPGPDWRERFRSHFSTEPMQVVSTGPEDLSPIGWTTAGMAKFGPFAWTQPDYSPEVLTETEPALAPAIEEAVQSAETTAVALDDEAIAIAPPPPATDVASNTAPTLTSTSPEMAGNAL